MTKRIWSGIVMALCMALCTGCKPSQMQAAKASEEKEIGLKVQVLNYMDEGLGVVYVNGVWAGSMSSHAGGHSIAGAIGLPAKWHPGLTVEVEWRDNTLWEKDPNGLYKAQVLVEPYDIKYDGFLWLAFFPGGRIKVIASGYGPGNPNFPADWKFPFDVCMIDAACAAKFYPDHRILPEKDQ
ncbi:DUF3304 domain-containing protein [Ralstonia pseudosolanacearum]|uniref:DUF3304 domain-containing protein n=1 Tax=Ralstonia solanacearum species complex TaxID=3116862 RepID=UPI000C1FB064|nr:DUF3304 domain-containing protein [Ralstonia pseudosolanacearum]MCK4125303.1 DUF3304 domain-containing protein [Ralstonia pseudosolanacearum]MDO3618504.1 DUF3304 domain-containing protein [Ralstonia pseudosolanacearum]